MSLYLTNSKRFGWGPGLATLNPKKTELLRRFAIGRILDVGCGSGIYSNYLAQNNHPVVGLDGEMEFVQSDRLKYPKVKFVKASAEKLPFSAGDFDTVILFDILEHLDDKKLLQEALRVGRRLIISVPLANQTILTEYGLSHAHYLDQTHRRVYTLNTLKRLFNKVKIIYLRPALPLSLSGLLINQLSRGFILRRTILKILLKPFLPEPPLYSTIFAVVEKS